VVDRFEKFIAKGEGCWEWTGAYSKGRWSSYPSFWLAGKARRAHHVAWERANGPIPNSLWVLHKCDNPKCVRPDHLFLETHSDNMLDSVRKRRQNNARKTHCPRGHVLTRRTDDPSRRGCVICGRERGRKYWRRKFGPGVQEAVT